MESTKKIFLFLLFVLVLIITFLVFAHKKSKTNNMQPPAGRDMQLANKEISPANQNDLKILFIGVDGADWEMVNYLVTENKLPNFKKIIKSGTSAKINTNDEGGSAAYWTTIATGQLAKKHGIKGFVLNDAETKEEVLYTSNMRKVKAFWNILSENNISVGVSGWYVTWPAERVNGFLVSSYYGKKYTTQPTWRGSFYEDIPDILYPPALMDKVEGLVEKTQNNINQKLGKIIKLSSRKTSYRGSHLIPIRSVKWTLFADELFKEIGFHLYKELHPRVFAVYFGGIDIVGHRFYSAKDIAKIDKKKEKKRRKNIRRLWECGDVSKNYYLYIDKVLGDILSLKDENTIVIVAADHGIMRRRHTNNGVFIISGPYIYKDIKLEREVNLTDICPTMLYLLNLPVAKDMNGEVVRGAISQQFLRKNEIKFIDTYGAREIKDTTPKKSRYDEEIKERLRALGYLN